MLLEHRQSDTTRAPRSARPAFVAAMGVNRCVGQRETDEPCRQRIGLNACYGGFDADHASVTRGGFLSTRYGANRADHWRKADDEWIVPPSFFIFA